MRVAVIHEFLYVFGGAERVLKAILNIFPDADLFCLFDVLDDDTRKLIGIKESKTSFLQKMPQIRKRHRLYLPLMPIAIEQFDLSEYDLIISSNASVAKGVITGPDQLHISYIHSPMRYAWDMQHEYLRQANKNKGISGVLARYLLHRMRIWDVRTAHGPDVIVANSHYIARRIRKAYGRDAFVIYPPVRISTAQTLPEKGNFFLAASRFVPYKNIHVIAEAFAKYLPDQRLVIVGDGPDKKRIQAVSGKNVDMVGFVTDVELADYMARARAFIFAAEEDFGIVPVEAQASGTPVIALGKGGVRETVIVDGYKRTGIFFDQPESRLIADAVNAFLADEPLFHAQTCIENAARFSEQRFDLEFRRFVLQQLDLFKNRVKTSHGPTATAMTE